MSSFLIYIILGLIIVGVLNMNKKKQQNVLGHTAPSSKFEMTDELVIRLAKRLGGKITASDLSAQTSMTVEQAKERLDGMLMKGLCEINLNEVDLEGKVYYHFD